MNLDSITRELSALISECERSSKRCAELILDARDTFFPGDSLAWLEWGSSQLGLARRQMFLYAGCGEFLRAIPDRMKKAYSFDRIDLEKIESIRAIRKIDPKIKKLELFLQKHRVAEMDREEVRDAVRLFLGRRNPEQSPEQIEFFDKLDLPAPSELLTDFRANKHKVDPVLAAQYGSVFLTIVAERISDIPENQRLAIRNSVDKMYEFFHVGN